jgi:hypothetical protein
VRGEIGGHRLRASAAKRPDRVELCPSVDLKSRHPLEALADKSKNHQNRGNTRMRGLAQSTFSTPPIDVGMDVARPTKVVQPVITHARRLRPCCELLSKTLSLLKVILTVVAPVSGDSFIVRSLRLKRSHKSQIQRTRPISKERAHERPSQTGSLGDGLVDVAQASDTRRQKMDLLVGDSRLDPVSDMPIDFLDEANRRLPSAR